MFEDKKIAVLGAGKLGEALITGLIEAGVAAKENFIATAAHEDRLSQLRSKLGIATTLSNQEAVRKANIVLLCVKPQTVKDVVTQIADDLTPNHLVISVAASVTIRFIEELVPKPIPIIRVMQNTPCLIR